MLSFCITAYLDTRFVVMNYDKMFSILMSSLI